MNTVWQSSRASGNALLVLLAIADNANDAGTAWPSVDTIARKARCSERRAQRHLRRLEALGELQVEKQAGPRGCNLYRVTVCRPDVSATPGDGLTGDSLGGGDGLTGGQMVQGGVAKTATGGVTPPSPEPSLNHQEPSSYKKKGGSAVGKGTKGTDGPGPADGGPADGGSGAGALTEAQVRGSAMRYAALNARIVKAEASLARGELDAGQVEVLKKMRAERDELQKKQARGEF